MNRRLARIDVGLRERAAASRHVTHHTNREAMNRLMADPQAALLVERIAEVFVNEERARRAGLAWVAWDGLTAEERAWLDGRWREVEWAVRDPTRPTRVLVDR